MKNKTFEFDEMSMKVIEEIKLKLNLEDNSDVLSRSITLLKIAADASENGLTTVIGGREVLL